MALGVEKERRAGRVDDDATVGLLATALESSPLPLDTLDAAQLHSQGKGRD
jgi:hypothetical protein